MATKPSVLLDLQALIDRSYLDGLAYFVDGIKEQGYFEQIWRQVQRLPREDQIRILKRDFGPIPHAFIVEMLTPHLVPYWDHDLPHLLQHADVQLISEGQPDVTHQTLNELGLVQLVGETHTIVVPNLLEVLQQGHEQIRLDNGLPYFITGDPDLHLHHSLLTQSIPLNQGILVGARRRPPLTTQTGINWLFIPDFMEAVQMVKGANTTPEHGRTSLAQRR